MKKCYFAFTMLILLILLAVGCTRIPSSPIATPSPAQEAPSEDTLSSSDTEPASPGDTTEKELGIRLVWTIESGVRLEDATVPNIYRMADGRLRMYYGGKGGILSAVSDDGLTFSKEPGVRVPSGSQGSPEMIVSDPTLVTLKDGRVRMYYKGASGPGGPGQSVHKVFSAISPDGLLFKKEGIRIDSQQTSDRGWASVPEAVVLPDGRVRLYYVSNSLDVKHGIVSAISDDGLAFTREETRLTGFVDPAVVRLTNGSYLLLAVAFPFASQGKLTDAAPGIYSFTSRDGLNFGDRQLVLAGEGNVDPAIIDSGYGAYRVYYWSIMDQTPVIRSLSGKMASSSSTASASTVPDIEKPASTPEISPAQPELTEPSHQIKAKPNLLTDLTPLTPVLKSYIVAGEQRQALVCLPDAAPPYPVVIYNHGLAVDEYGYQGAQERGYEIGQISKALAENGFLVFVPIRKSGPRNIDLHKKEVTAAIDYVKTIADVDISRIALMGFSRGGLLTLMAGIERDDLKALILLAPAPGEGRFSEAVKHVDSLNIPIFLAVEAEDSPQILNDFRILEQALQEHKKDFQAIRYHQGGGHKLFWKVSYWWEDVSSFLSNKLARSMP